MSFQWNTVDFRPAVAGWRVLYLDTTTDVGVVETAMPGWLIQESVWVKDGPTHQGIVSLAERPYPSRRVLAADVRRGELVAASEHVNFWVVLGPGEGDPTEEEEQTERRRRGFVNECGGPDPRVFGG